MNIGSTCSSPHSVMGVWQVLFALVAVLGSAQSQNTPPVFTNASYNVEVSEAIENGTLLEVNIEASDPDGVVFGIDSGSAFSINSTTGDITVKNTDLLDYEVSSTVIVTITATDLNANPASSSADLVVTLTNVNDNAPVFQDLPYTFSVVEEETGAFVGTIRATDADEDSLSYFIMDTTLSEFKISTANNEATLTVTTKLDFETESKYSFIVVVSDGTNSASINVNVTVIDIIDQRPLIKPVTSELLINLDDNQRMINMSHLEVTDDGNLYSGAVEIKHLLDGVEAVSN